VKTAALIALTVAVAATGCAGREKRLLHDTDHAALVAACRLAMQALPPAGPPINPVGYGIDPGDSRFQSMFATLQARTVTFQAAPERPAVTDSRLPSEILRLEPVYVAVTPDAVHIALCGSGLSCSANVTRSGAGLDVLRHLKGGQPNCRAVVEGLWYCHE
jgi:hypothetical protein